MFGKLLSGGYLPLAVTLASAETFNSFLGSEKASALLHGHSYAGNPLCCAAALEGIRIFEHAPRFSADTVFMNGGFALREVKEISRSPGVEGAMGLGSVLAVELSTDSRGYSSDASARVVELLKQDRVMARPLGNVVYVMVTPVSSQETVDRILKVLKRCLTKAYYDGIASGAQKPPRSPSLM